MKNIYIFFYGIGSIIAFVGFVLWLVLSIYFIRDKNTEDAKIISQDIKNTIVNSYLIKGDFKSDFYRQNIVNYFTTNPNLKSLLILNQSNEIEYFYSKFKNNKDEIKSLIENNNYTKLQEFNPLYEVQNQYRIVIPAAGSFGILINHIILKYSEVVSIINTSIIIVFVYVMLTAILIFSYYITKNHPQHTADVRNDSLLSNPGNYTEKPAPVLNTQMNINQKQGTEKKDNPKQNLDQKGLFTPNGLCWEDLLESRLSFELERAASFDQDLSMMIIKITNTEKGTSQYTFLAEEIKTAFTFHDLNFEYGDNGFAIILPNIDIESSIRKIEAFEHKLLFHEKRDIEMRAGLSSRNGRIINGTTLFNEAKTASEKAIKDKTSIVAFQSDPAKYRKYLAGKKL